jgi:hypothetical protein
METNVAAVDAGPAAELAETKAQVAALATQVAALATELAQAKLEAAALGASSSLYRSYYLAMENGDIETARKAKAAIYAAR